MRSKIQLALFVFVIVITSGSFQQLLGDNDSVRIYDPEVVLLQNSKRNHILNFTDSIAIIYTLTTGETKC